MTEEKYFFEKEVFSNPKYKFHFKVDKELLDEVLNFKKSGKVLELGCGEGGTSLELAKRGFDVTCIDISKSAINKIKNEAEKRKVKIRAICKDLEDYNLEDNYDIIIANGFFHFLKKERTLNLIEDCKNHTKKEGMNIFEVMLEGDPSQEEDSEGYYFPTNKLKEIYSDWEIEDYDEYEDYDEEEEWNNKLARIIALKP